MVQYQTSNLPALIVETTNGLLRVNLPELPSQSTTVDNVAPAVACARTFPGRSVMTAVLPIAVGPTQSIRRARIGRPMVIVAAVSMMSGFAVSELAKEFSPYVNGQRARISLHILRCGAFSQWRQRASLGY